jgi:ankyrin repeat protein
LLRHGARVDARDDSGCTPLIAAAEGDDARAIQELLKRGASLNAKDRSGRTPLIAAAQWGRVSSIEALVGAGADVGSRDNRGNTALNYASTEARRRDTSADYSRVYRQIVRMLNAALRRG